jgi:hypothetical protein
MQNNQQVNWWYSVAISVVVHTCEQLDECKRHCVAPWSML